MSERLISGRNDDFVIAGWAEGAQPAFFVVTARSCEADADG